MAEEEDEGLGLSLSLKCPDQSLQPARSLNLHSIFQNRKLSLINPLQSSSEARSYLRGIDVNRRPATGDWEEEVGASSPNSTISSVSGKRSEREENEGERRGSSSRGVSDDDDGGDAGRKKLRLSREQTEVLEETFKEHTTLNPKQKVALAKKLNLRPRQVEVWFQNRRARTKLKQTEVDCEYLKRCCENLTEENRRLQKEVNELRTLKRSPQPHMNMNPPTTLTMCPSCERVAALPSLSSATASTTPPAATVPTTSRHRNPVVGPQRQSPTASINSWLFNNKNSPQAT